MWKTKKLGDICQFVRGPFGGSLKKSFFVKNGLAVYEQKNAIKNQCKDFRYFITQKKFKEMSRFAVNAGDILMSCSGTIGKSTIVPKGAPKGIINQALLKITPSDVLDVRFLKFYMESKIFIEQLMDTVDGAAIQNVASVKILKNITIYLPPLNEQKRIVLKLDEIFTEIDRAIGSSEKSILTAQTGLENVIDQKTLEKKSWNTFKVSELGLVQTGSTPKTSNKDNYGNEVPFIKPPHFNSDGTISITNDGLSTKGSKFSRKTPQNSVMMVCIGATIGKVGICNRDVCFNQQINSLAPDSKFDAEFIYWQMRGNRFQKAVLRESGKATLPIINKSKWQDLKVHIPPSLEDQVAVRNTLRIINNNTETYCLSMSMKIKELHKLKLSILNYELLPEKSEAA
tara:strand:+ start:1458 stop:2654 length:1197 start_codon:yes stop_codon:yes gene_type:complete